MTFFGSNKSSYFEIITNKIIVKTIGTEVGLDASKKNIINNNSR